MKVLYRPHGLHPHAEDAAAELGFALRDETLRVDNPTPYFVSLAGLALEIGRRAWICPERCWLRARNDASACRGGWTADARRGGVRLDRRQRRQPPGKESSTVNGSPQARQHEHPPAVAASLAGDLRLARRFQAALASGRVRLDWQAVRHAGHPEWEPLYRETLLRVTAASGEPPLPTQELILALERLGLIRLLDRCVLGTVLDRLNAEPTLRLACNLSRQSAAMDAWWEAVCRWLAARPQVARRLTLELTETAVGERVATREFIRRLREHGVRIAIDDFGAAHNNLDFVLDARPDVIKIDCRYTREARRSAKGAEVLRHLLALCRELAPCVVLEGLEEDDAFARLPTGDVYLQGNAIAPPMRVEPPLSVRRPKSRARIEALASRQG